jgi:two-component system cell cycle sensor histidine kinase/response regulator CckA
MSPEKTSDPHSILVIDDERDLLDILQVALEGERFKVYVAASGREALDLFERHWREIDLVLLDYVMPEMTGDLVFECMRQINPDVRVMLLSGSADHVANKMFAAGLRGYIRKPFYLDDVIARVREEIQAV